MGGRATAGSLRPRSAQRPQMAVNVMAEQLAARSSQPVRLGQLPSREPGPAQQGDVSNPKPRQEAHSGTHTTPTHILWDQHDTCDKDPPCSGQSPLSESLPKSLAQAEGRGEAAWRLGLDLVQRLQQVVAGEGAGLQGAVGPAGKEGSVGGASTLAAGAQWAVEGQGPLLQLRTFQRPFF